MRVFEPLKKDHPMVTGRDLCGMCHEKFREGQRVTLVAIPQTQKGYTAQALPVHANCAYRGKDTPRGKISRIKDGDGSPYPVELENNTQATLEECGIPT